MMNELRLCYDPLVYYTSNKTSAFGGKDMQPFTATVIKIIKEIPKGRVMSYGQIATYAGSPRGARQVVRILHSMSHKYGLPWHRVVNKVGEIRLNDSHQADMQKELLEQEGVFFIQAHQVDMSRSQYDRAK